MLQKVTSWLKAGLLFGGILLCAKLYFVAGSIEQSISGVSSDVGQIQGDIHGSAGKANALLQATAETVNLAKPKIGNALDDADKLLKASTKTVNDASPKLNAALDSVATLANASTETVNFAKPKVGIALDDAHHFLLEAGTTGEQVRKEELASGKQFEMFLGKMNTIADHTDTAILHGGKILANGEIVSDRLAKPVTATKQAASFIWNSFLHYIGAR